MKGSGTMTKTIAMFLIAAGLGTGIASAETVTVYGSTAPSVRVSYADLNLASHQGMARLQNRVRAAASDLCLESGKNPLAFEMKRKTCFRTAVDSGFAQIDRLVADQLAGNTSPAIAIVIAAR
jgi:UrcA family protein